MGIDFLEEKYLKFARHRGPVQRLRALSDRYFEVQEKLRVLLEEVSPSACAECGGKCCRGLKADGWFTMEDYFIVRVRLATPPHPDRGKEGDVGGCSFLTERGCSLPGNARPFACIIYDCTRVYDELRRVGTYSTYVKFKDELKDIHGEAVGTALCALETEQCRGIV